MMESERQVMRRAAVVTATIVQLAVVVVIALVVASSVLARDASAQRMGAEPKLKRGAIVPDSNDALALYRVGMQVIERDPAKAADAFYWAARVNPAAAEPLYGRYAALILRDPTLLRRRLQQTDRNPSKELRQLDSLLLRALTINPFLYRRFDQTILRTALKQSVTQAAGGPGEVNSSELDYAITNYLNRAGHWMQGWMAYSEGRFPDALALYASAEKATRQKASIRIDRGRIFGMTGVVDSAVAELQAALTELRASDEKDRVVVYNSKARLEHSIGTLLEGKDDIAGAREAYGRALQEDLAFYPAHLRIGLLALGQRDTTTAISELEVAAQVAADDPYVHYTLGFTLAYAQQLDRAVEALTKASTLEPLYAMPHAMLGRVWEAKRDAVKAAAAYDAYLARASQSDPQRAEIQQRLDDVKAFLKGRD